MTISKMSHETEVVVRGSGDGFAQEISARTHHVFADEPRGNGGTDTGPTPYEFLLAALGSCASMTVALYARRKTWPLEQVTIRLRHDRVHARDCAECETREGWLDQIQWSLELSGELTDTQRARLLEIAQMCPVHRTLRSEIHILPPANQQRDGSANA